MMKLLFTLVFTSTMAFAGETVLLEVKKSDVKRYFNTTDSRFHINLETNEVSGVLDFIYSSESCTTTGSGEDRSETCTTHNDVVKSSSAVIQGLTKLDDKLVMNSESSQIVCANLKKGRIFKNTIRILLTGDCKLVEKVVKTEEGKRFQLIFKTVE